MGFRRVVGGRFPVENKGEREGGGEGGGWGGDRQRNRQVNAQALSKLPFSDLPFSFSPKNNGKLFTNYFLRRVIDSNRPLTSILYKHPVLLTVYESRKIWMEGISLIF